MSFVFFYLVSMAVAAELKGTCTRVLDGDTIEVHETAEGEPTRIRLAQIDAPEKTQEYGVPAKVNLADMVLNHEVVVEYDKKDRYGRVIGQVYVVNGVELVDANFAQISAGLAWVYRDYPHTQIYVEEEQDARKAERGLWKDPFPIPPWHYRKMKKQK